MTEAVRFVVIYMYTDNVAARQGVCLTEDIISMFVPISSGRSFPSSLRSVLWNNE